MIRWEKWIDELGIVLPSVLAYLIATAILVRVMKNRKAFELRMAMVIHNFISMAMAVVMFSGIIFSLLENLGQFSIHDLICDPTDVVYPSMALWIKLFYWSKYYEFLDTAILVLRKKSISRDGYLHVFHHSSYIVACAGASNSRTTFQWIQAALNTFIHSVMYTYYFLTSVGWGSAWVRSIAKKITIMQMIQFVIGNAAGIYWYYWHFVLGCHGEIIYGYLSTILTATYLIQFSFMSTRKYQSKGKPE